MALSKPPTGTVTFLFTDIVGSTEMWEQHGDAFLPVLQAHNAILSDAVARYGGHLFKTEGDAYKVVFADPAAAVKCALLAQAALQRYPWPSDVGPLRVRMALHTGTPFIQAGDYFGPPVNRTARILSAVHGGQILMSEATLNCVEQQMEPGTRFIDQGHHQLNDLADKIHLYQAAHPALEQHQFPPPRSLNGHAHNLPAQRRSFVGREKEIAQIASEFASGDTRLLTLTGPQGIGKTRLAVQASAEHIDLFPDGVWIVSLANATDVTAAVIQVADAMHIPLPPGAPPLATVRDYLANRDCLLILDDVGNVPQSDRLIRELLTESSALRCLATSRLPLPTDDGAEIPVPELSRPPIDATQAELMASESGRLFVEVVHENNPKFEMTAQTARTIGGLLNKIPKLTADIATKTAESLKKNESVNSFVNAFDQVVSPVRTAAQHAATQGREMVAKMRPEFAAVQQSIANATEPALDPEEAERRWRDVLMSCHRAGNALGAAQALRKLGNIAFDRRDFVKAIRLLASAHEVFLDHRHEESRVARIELENARRALGQEATLDVMPLDRAVSAAMEHET